MPLWGHTGNNPSDAYDPVHHSNTSFLSQESNASSTWAQEDPLQALPIREDRNVVPPEKGNRESDRQKHHAKISSEFSRLNLPTVARFRSKQRQAVNNMEWTERSAYTSHQTYLGADPTIVERQKAIRARENTEGTNNVFDLQTYETFRMSQDDTIRRTNKGDMQLCRAPLISTVCGLHPQSAVILKQTYPERIAEMLKMFPSADTHKKLDLKKFQIAGLKQALLHYAHSFSLSYNVYQTLIMEEHFSKMEGGPLYAQLMGNLLKMDLQTLESVGKLLGKIPDQQLVGKKYLDLHPGATVKDWLSKESSSNDILPRKPLPHPQVFEKAWKNQLRQLGFSFKGNPNNFSPDQKKNKGGPKRKRKGNDPKRKKPRGNKPKGPPFWKRGPWDCKNCKIRHPKGHYCKKGIQAGKPTESYAANRQADS